ncbi:hypothetical protein [Fibrella forsythiae]|uniref:Type VI secretion system baseplate subunit TssK n=1 Tax=Fibrella forsythiae TaxID=2817061 RepID=A0ABS3JAW3_9BACT|nr:hypothetical protein [Fibrella forsythiae]MBO0947126.1 hypothetical protein [Fibrella forsythiae]
MLVARTYHPVNWVNGMKLSQSHFLDTDQNVQDMVRDALSLFLTNYNYGLLPPERGSVSSNEIELLEKIGNHVEVRLLRCNAITSGGCRVAINPEVLRFRTLTASFAVETELDDIDRPPYDIVLLVNPFERVPMGEPDPEESPLRHPFTDTHYQLQAIPTAQLNADELGQHYLTIGRVVCQEGRYVVEESFIPPCTSLSSHPKLMAYYKGFGWSLNDLQISSFKIVRKVFDRNQPSDIAKNVQMLCIKLLDSLGQLFFEYRNLDYQHPPVKILDYFANLTSLIYTNLYCIPTREKEELLHYFYEWTDVTPNHFEGMLLSLLELDYNHNRIGEAMRSVETFLDVITRLWNKLSTLEYIGQRKDNIVVREESGARPATRRGWSVLD